MKSPLVTKKKHDTVVAELQAAVEGEYARAMADGRAIVREWAVDANYNMFMCDSSTAKGKATAAFQDVIGRFKPEVSRYAR